MRGLVKEIESMNDEEVNKLNLPTAIPFVYHLDPETLKPLGGKILYFLKYWTGSLYSLKCLKLMIIFEAKKKKTDFA